MYPCDIEHCFYIEYSGYCYNSPIGHDKQWPINVVTYLSIYSILSEMKLLANVSTAKYKSLKSGKAKHALPTFALQFPIKWQTLGYNNISDQK